ncbi:MAG: hypothetical protein LBT43_06735, partial [Prevotella sp.]|nr:hypothetical protein [Prevotella sp.]
PDRKIGAITILPAISESLKAQVNAYECLRELQNLDELCAAFVIDNNGHGDKMVINSMFAELFSQMLKIPTYIDSRSNVDVSELKETLTAHGCAVITKLPQNQSSTPRLLDSFKNNIFAQLEEDEAIQYLLLSMASGIDVEAVKKKVGTPIDVFQGFNQRETICVLSGLSFPMTRIAGIAAEVNELKNKIQRSRIQRPAAPDDTLNMDSMALGRKSNKPKHKKTKEELFANYRK